MIFCRISPRKYNRFLVESLRVCAYQKVRTVVCPCKYSRKLLRCTPHHGYYISYQLALLAFADPEFGRPTIISLNDKVKEYTFKNCKSATPVADVNQNLGPTSRGIKFVPLGASSSV